MARAEWLSDLSLRVEYGAPGIPRKSEALVERAPIPPYGFRAVNGIIRGNNVSPSDSRLKKEIEPLENPLHKIAQLRGVSFNWKDEEKGTDREIGVIAQEVEKEYPELVSTDNEGYKSVAYGKLTAVLIEAMKVQQSRITELEARIEDLQNQISR
uniref:Chaperone of endosialidase n=1 Tax=Candidatus Kentrum sp. LFY TaxID=2126342 RepID=A0A450VDD5_9GAMM|nr:MAG: Chaperone of endosialidase [Candidatus Kentron sp. LFY]